MIATELAEHIATMERALVEARRCLIEMSQKEQREKDELLNRKQAATFMGVSPSWLRANQEKFAFTRRLSPHVVRYSKAGIQKWIEAKR